MKREPDVYLADIINAAADIQTYTIGLKKGDFFIERMMQDAVIRKLSVIGEAVKRLPPDFRQAERRVPWKKIAGMRDIVIHDYAEIDLNLVWDVIKKDLPELIQAIQRIMKKRG